MTSIQATATFVRTVKKLHSGEKLEVDHAIQSIATNPAIGQAKKGDLQGVRVYKFRVNKQEMLLAYMSQGETLVLLALGSHENFYKDLSKT